MSLKTLFHVTFALKITLSNFLKTFKGNERELDVPNEDWLGILELEVKWGKMKGHQLSRWQDSETATPSPSSQLFSLTSGFIVYELGIVMHIPFPWHGCCAAQMGSHLWKTLCTPLHAGREKAVIFNMNQRAFEMILALMRWDVLWLGRW